MVALAPFLITHTEKEATGVDTLSLPTVHYTEPPISKYRYMKTKTQQFKYTCKHVVDGEYVFYELKKCSFLYKVLFWLISIPLVIVGMIKLLREDQSI